MWFGRAVPLPLLPAPKLDWQRPPRAGTQCPAWGPQGRSRSGAYQPLAEGTGQICWRGLPFLLWGR